MGKASTAISTFDQLSAFTPSDQNSSLFKSTDDKYSSRLASLDAEDSMPTQATKATKQKHSAKQKPLSAMPSTLDRRQFLGSRNADLTSTKSEPKSAAWNPSVASRPSARQRGDTPVPTGKAAARQRERGSSEAFTEAFTAQFQPR